MDVILENVHETIVDIMIIFCTLWLD